MPNKKTTVLKFFLIFSSMPIVKIINPLVIGMLLVYSINTAIWHVARHF